MSRPAWAAIASTSAGWQWPMAVTPQPALRSTSSRPSRSRTREPRPSTSTIGSRFTTGRNQRASRSLTESMLMERPRAERGRSAPGTSPSRREGAARSREAGERQELLRFEPMAGTLRPPLVDRFDRRIESMRLSVTDRCDLRCFYCIPDEDIEWLPRQELLRLEEVGRVARIAVESGVRKLRLTGGEPLLRKDLPVLVELLARLPHLHHLALTTNGTRLARLAEPLVRAG